MEYDFATGKVTTESGRELGKWPNPTVAAVELGTTIVGVNIYRSEKREQ